eukprot:Skav212712  [mRNA]  locus=scaffold113:236765:243904:- [translate_table: standard]
MDRWEAFLSSLTCPLPPDTGGAQDAVNKWWNEISCFLEDFLLHSARTFPRPMKTVKKPHRRKSSEVRFRQEPVVSKQAYDNHSPNELRCLRKLAGRLRQLKFRQDHGQTVSASDPLWLKIHKSPFWKPDLTIDALDKLIQAKDDAIKHDRLRSWRVKMKSSTTDMFRWLRVQATPSSHCIFNGARDPEDPVAASGQEALEKIHDFWQTVWNRPWLDNELTAEAFVHQHNLPARAQEAFGAVQQKKKRDLLSSDPDLSPHVTESLTALGVSFAAGHSKPSQKEASRFDSAHRTALKARALPISAWQRLFAVAASASSKAAYGWVLRAPTKAMTNKLEVQLRAAGWHHKQASPDLTLLINGHTLDVQFTSGLSTVSALYRKHKLQSSCSEGWNLKGGFASRARTFLRTLGWNETGTWSWQCQALSFSLNPASDSFPVSVEKLRHDLRESWRHHVWMKFKQSKRLDAGRLSEVDLDTQRLKVVMPLVKHGGSHAAAICSGAFVSITKYYVMGRVSETTCPFCSHPVANTEHLFWSCQVTNPQQTQPVDELERWLGWPMTASASQVSRLAEVTLEEFIDGIMRCKGPARAIDQVAMHAELKQLDAKVTKLFRKLMKVSKASHTEIKIRNASKQVSAMKVFRGSSMALGDPRTLSKSIGTTFSRLKGDE